MADKQKDKKKDKKVTSKDIPGKGLAKKAGEKLEGRKQKVDDYLKGLGI